MGRGRQTTGANTSGRVHLVSRDDGDELGGGPTGYGRTRADGWMRRPGRGSRGGSRKAISVSSIRCLYYNYSRRSRRRNEWARRSPGGEGVCWSLTGSPLLAGFFWFAFSALFPFPTHRIPYRTRRTCPSADGRAVCRRRSGSASQS